MDGWMSRHTDYFYRKPFWPQHKKCLELHTCQACLERKRDLCADAVQFMTSD